MCFIDLEPCELWSETERTARKAHRCSCCGGAILPGARYFAHFSKFEGDLSSEKMCTPCYGDRGDFAHEHGGVLPCPSYFPTVLKDCIAEDEASEQQWKPMLAALLGRSPETTP